jgi:hypothetical protein
MEKRTESDILAKAPIKVKLGDKDYKIPVLTVLPAREWRIKLDTALGDIVRNFQPAPTADTNAFSTGLTGALIHFPEKVVDLVFLYRTYGLVADMVVKEAIPDDQRYARFLELIAQSPLPEAPDFPHNSILANSTEEQLAAAFSAVMAVAYPFLPQIAMARQAVLGSFAQSAHSMNLQ